MENHTGSLSLLSTLVLAPGKRDHDQLLEDIRDIMNSVGHRHDADYEHLLAERVGDWFGQHFGTLDRDFHSLKK